MTVTPGKSIAVIICIGLVYFLSPILTPFILGILLAYLGDPLVSLLERLRVPRVLGVFCVFIIIALVLLVIFFLFVPLIGKQLEIIIKKVPAIIDWVQSVFVPWLNAHFDIQAKFSLDNLKEQLAANSEKATDIAALLVQAVTNSTFAIIAFFSNLLLVPVVTFYLMRDWPKVKKNAVSLLPSGQRETVVKLVKGCDEVVGAFFKGQLLVMLGLAIVYSTGLWLVGLPIALFVGLLSGLVAIVPYLGFIVGIVVASVAMYLETQQLSHVALVWLVYLTGQACESMVFTPLLVGDKIGLHPVAVIFAVLAGGVLFGFVGILLALPVSAVILVLLKHWFKPEGRMSSATRFRY